MHTLQSRYGHLVNNNTCVTKFNTLEALSERYDKEPIVKVEKKTAEKRTLPSTLTRRRSGRGRDRTEKAVTGSAAESAVKVEEEEDDTMEDAVDENDIDRDQIRYGDYGKPGTRNNAQGCRESLACVLARALLVRSLTVLSICMPLLPSLSPLHLRLLSFLPPSLPHLQSTLVARWFARS